MCVKVTTDLEFDVFVRCQRDLKEQCEYIAFESGKNTVAVRMGGKWAKQARVWSGFVDQETDLDKARELHPADLGYFFSPRSRSIGGCDGTNFAWGTLIEGWVQPLGEHGCDYAMEKLTNRTDTEYKQGPTMCVKVTTDLEFDVFVRCQRDLKEQCEYIAFEPGKNTVAVRMGGKWAKQARVWSGFVDQETDLDKARELHPADLGYFFSPRSRSIGGCDGTNFA